MLEAFQLYVALPSLPSMIIHQNYDPYSSDHTVLQVYPLKTSMPCNLCSFGHDVLYAASC